ncbi:MAG TPA: copper amine oxidase N-terminal domain-containing protein, partial [Armatimonadota bacterium]|nr:copper amine oxidase N-terminal domain-containing protein [Armatimonadota bacterium]
MLVPAEAFAAALGASFEYFGVNDTMRIIKDDVTVIFGLNVSVANVNDEPIQLDQSPLRDGGVVYVPARWLADTLGGSVHWVPDTLTLNVKSVKVDAPISPGGGDGGPIPVPQPITDGDAP